MRLLEWLRAVRELFAFMSEPEVTWDHKPIPPPEKDKSNGLR